MDLESAQTEEELPPKIVNPKECVGPQCLQNKATIAWKELRVVATDMKKNKKEILKGVSGYVMPNHMLAIMGPSGCGKSTLLDTLAGRGGSSLEVSGDVLLNGHSSNLSYGRSAYVTQDEVLVGMLTVRETLTYSALLRLSSRMSYAEKMKRVEDALVEMGLVGVQHTKIGNWMMKGISGGQKRRVSIGCELVTQPAILFLDEPTSGLDAASAFFVMDTVRTLAEKNRTVLTVIHQPSSEVFELFDQLCLLTRGSTIYFGPAGEALSMFNAAGLPCPNARSPSDHYLHVINEDFALGSEATKIENNIITLTTHYQKHLHASVIKDVEACAQPGPKYDASGNQANPMYQALVLSQRMFVNNMRNVGMFWIRLVMYLILCICMGTIFFDLGNSWKETFSRAAMLFFVAGFLTFMSISAFPAFAEDMAVFIRERLNGYYNISTFAIANTIASAPFIFGIAISSSAVLYWLAMLNDDGDRFPFFFLNLFVALMAAESAMMAIAAIIPHYLMGIAGGAGLLGIYMLVCGFFQPVDVMPKPVWTYPLHYISFHSYTFYGFMQNEFENTDGWGCPCADQRGGCPPALGGESCTASGDEVLNYWLQGGNPLGKWANFGIQWVMVAGYRIIFWGLLALKEKLNQ
ncbi:P-loop containing nucleoside triphosphate hydrolase protein [Dunaliella salina]|uniref:P-loop containing nucleoside triphosphate hydrolase protein n=1 Tax=Dunaliella salina TaxID=3046 RepID=A0ABQ7H320_DUNSA|nr:P-loop containing nucleoside triphosphate hydrolase protein [Dunaliella salina]|eukprot:KAF5841257.1 P-loop containing nucleoside triphosphate hydrolase protein [Dunaliella salina]